MPKGIPLTKEEISRRRHEILDVAMNLFVEKGFTETSMRDISEAAGAGKSTLYDYFPSKDEILVSYVVDEVHHMTTLAKEIIALEKSATEKIRCILRKHLEYILMNKVMYQKLTLESQRLGFDSLQRIQKYRYAYQDMICDLIKEGIAGGEFRDVNPLLAIRGMLAMLTSAVYTSRPTGSPEEMILEVFDIFFNGLAAR